MNMNKFQIDDSLSNLKLKDKISGTIDNVVPKEKEPEVYDYGKLLAGGEDLGRIVNEGGTLFFDCPPLSYQENFVYNIDESGKENKDYFSIVDQDTPFGQVIGSKTPRIARDEDG